MLNLFFHQSCSKDQPLTSLSNDEQMEVDEEDADDNGTEKNAAYQLIKKFSKEVEWERLCSLICS